MRKRRNLLVILTGSMRSDAFGASGAWPLRTPHLDALAEYGMAFSAVTASPLATPSMASLLTGLHPRQHGLLDDDAAATAADIAPLTFIKQLIDGGYRAFGVGRVSPIASLLDRACVVQDDGDQVHACDYLKWMDRRGLVSRVMRQRTQRQRTGPYEMDAAGLIAPTDDIDGFIIQQATEMMEHLPPNKPWVLIVAFSGPGNDLPAPPQYLNHVPPLKADRFVAVDMRNIDHYAELTHPRTLVQKLTPAKLLEIRRHYLARVMLIDQAVGLLRQSLERHHQGGTTWIALASDRGKLLGERGVVGNQSLLGPAVSVPLWVLPPDGLVAADVQSDPALTSHELISTIDLAPTLCAIAGVDPPSGSPGESLLSAFRGEIVGRPAAISEYANRLMLETMQHRVVFDIDTEQPRALFDLLNDPDERCDLVGTPEGLGVTDMLRWQLAGSLMRLRPRPRLCSCS